jgi:catecholate siderophore receptor
MPSTPRNNFNLWSTYEVVPKLTVGAGATFVDQRFGNEANSIEVPSYWRYDAMASYKLTKNVDLQLNVQNLTNKRYFDQIFTTHYAHVAPGRTAMMSASFHF